MSTIGQTQPPSRLMTSFDPGSLGAPTHTPDELMELERQHGAAPRAPLPVVIARGRGCWVQDMEGRRYLDLRDADSALSLGHRNPRLIAALKAQADRVTLTAGDVHSDKLGLLVSRLSALTGFEVVRPTRTAEEALEVAITAARGWASSTKGIAACDAGVVMLDAQAASPSGANVVVIPPGDLEVLEGAVGPQTAAVIMEPVQLASGLDLLGSGFLRSVRELCDAKGVLLLLDERRTGLGRTGKLFAWSHAGVRPDGVILGQVLGGGVLSMAAFLGDPSLRTAVSGNTTVASAGPLAAAVALAVIDVTEEDGLIERAATMGAPMLEGLRSMEAPKLASVRGIGLLIDLEIKASAGTAERIRKALLDKGVLTAMEGPQTVRLAPPLNIDSIDIEWALSCLREVLA